MNILRHLPKTSLPLNRYCVLNYNEVTSSASYSNSCMQRLNRPVLSTVPVNFVQKRQKSITESVAEIYTSVSHSTTVSYFQNAFMSFHDFTGLPWWATIVI